MEVEASGRVVSIATRASRASAPKLPRTRLFRLNTSLGSRRPLRIITIDPSHQLSNMHMSTSRIQHNQSTDKDA
jgi:hypothetical protein